MKSFTKNIFHLFLGHKTRFFTIIAIVIVCIGFVSGIGELESKIKYSVTDFYQERNVSDIYVKSKNAMGFSSNEISKLEDMFGGDNILKTFCYEEETDSGVVRYYYFDLENSKINKVELIEGEYPTQANEVIVERKTTAIEGYKIGDEIEVKNPLTQQTDTYKVSGIIINPYILSNIEEPSFLNEGETHLINVVYFNTDFTISTPPYPSMTLYNDVYIANEDRELFDSFSAEYEQDIDTKMQSILDKVGEENVAVLSLYENFGLYSLVEYAKKVGIIGIIFVVFFLLVAMLVVYSTTSRLMDEERAQMACMKTLGYTNFRIILKYLLFVLFATIIGGGIAFPVGHLLTKMLFVAFNMQYAMPPFPMVNHYLYYGATFLITLVAVLILTALTGRKMVEHKPVELLLPKAPKSGKKVLIERIPFIWKRLSFKYKSTMRNVFLFKSRFFMTVISIIGSTVLVFAGFGLMDNALKYEGGETLLTISLALLAFSAVLCALVVYNITNINVSERNREIATLMVLGYTDREVCGYINREIYIMAIIGAVLGLPVGILFVDFAFGLINFGSISSINWWTYIVAPVLTVMFSFIATFMLKRKIIKTDMNASLKSIE